MRSLFHTGNVSRFERELGRLATPEKIGLNQRPKDRVTAELGKNIGGINLARNVEEPQNIRRNCFTDSMVR